MKNYIKAASWFVAFEAVFWIFGMRFVTTIEQILVYGYWGTIDTVSEVIAFVFSPFAIALAVYCFAMFIKNLIEMLKE